MTSRIVYGPYTASEMSNAQRRYNNGTATQNDLFKLGLTGSRPGVVNGQNVRVSSTSGQRLSASERRAYRNGRRTNVTFNSPEWRSITRAGVRTVNGRSSTTGRRTGNTGRRTSGRRTGGRRTGNTGRRNTGRTFNRNSPVGAGRRYRNSGGRRRRTR